MTYTERGSRFASRGVTLIELVVSITILSIAVSSVLGLLSSISARSGDAMIRQQGVAIASAYLNEVLLRSYQDPSGPPVEPARNLFDDVGDYNGLTDNGARDQFNIPIAGLDQFQVAVSVVTPGAGALGAVALADMRRVDVTVTHSSGITVALSGYRTRYP